MTGREARERSIEESRRIIDADVVALRACYDDLTTATTQLGGAHGPIAQHISAAQHEIGRRLKMLAADSRSLDIAGRRQDQEDGI